MSDTARICVDVGGTFTDFVLHDPARNLVATGKRLTTPDDPSEAIIAGIARLLEETGVATAPGIDFDPVDGHRFVRFSFAVSTPLVEEAIARMVPWFQAHSALVQA